MHNYTRLPAVLAGLVLTVLLSPAQFAAPSKAIDNPDLTKGHAIPADASHDWNLGATGARGWMYSSRLTTIDARQIAITQVQVGSPAEGVLQKGDVILGVADKPFAYNARVEFGKALTQAESQAGKGKLTLTRWRDGQTQSVVIKLPILGTYSRTAPYNCEKSKRLLEQGCEALAKRIGEPRYRENPMVRSLNAMALLASGNEKYLPLIKKEAEWAADYKATSFATWWYGYAIMFLSEYVIETGDQSVMPGLERLVMESAEGQSIVGSWGHRFAKPNGILAGYGMMNAPGLTLTTGLVLAREAGVKDPKLDTAIQKSVDLLRFYVGKGSIPYGDHDPWIQTHDDNGKNGIAAVLFNLLGDRDAAEYFSRMSVASHSAERECGHTGNFLNITWAMPGVNPSGPNATGAWMNEYGGWYFDLARQWDGTFRHQGPPQVKPDRFRNWDTTGANLLAYAMPLKKLRVTGKGRSVVPKVSAAEASKLIEDGRGWNNKDRNSYYDALSTEQVLEKLGSWSPIVRERAGAALQRRKADVLPQVIAMLKSDDLYARYGACKAIRQLRGDRSIAVPALIETLEAKDMWLRILSAQALAGLGNPGKQAVPAMLKRLASGGDVANDPRKMEQRYLTFALFNRGGGLIGRSLDGVDRDLLVKAVKAGLANDDGRARGALGSVYRNLSLQEIRPLLPAIHQAVIESAPSGIMFASGIRTEGLSVLAKHNVDEGIDAGVSYLEETWNEWGQGRRTPAILNELVKYGANAQRAIPRLEAIAEQMAAADAKRRERARNHLDQKVREAIEKIKASNHKPELIKIGLDNVPRVGHAGDQGLR